MKKSRNSSNKKKKTMKKVSLRNGISIDQKKNIDTKRMTDAEDRLLVEIVLRDVEERINIEEALKVKEVP